MNQDTNLNLSQQKDFKFSSPIVNFFNDIHPLRPEIISKINEHTYSVELKSGKFLISPLKTDTNLYLITKGVIRGYIKDGNKEITTWFSEEREMIGSIRNLGLKSITDEYLQALEDATLIAVPRALIEEMYVSFPETNTIARILLEENYRGAEERAYICRIPSATKRYQRFVQTRPSLLQRIPLKYIASYLAIRFETLSRIRNKV